MWTYNYELYHHGVKGMRWGVRRYQNKDGTLTSAGKKRKKVNYSDEAKSMTDDELRSQVKRLDLERRYSSLSGGSRNDKGIDAINNVANIGREGVKAGKTALKYDTSERIKKAGDDLELKKSIASKSGRMSSTLNLAGSGVDVVSKGVSTAKQVEKLAYNRKKAQRDRASLSTMSDKELERTVERLGLEQRYASLKNESVSRGKASVGEILGIAGGVIGVGVGVAGLALEIYKLRKGKG